MVKRMFNKERIQQLATEAAAGEETKAEKKKKTTTPRKKATTAVERQKAVWKVFDSNYKEVACFPYSEKDEAYAKADVLTKKKQQALCK